MGWLGVVIVAVFLGCVGLALWIGTTLSPAAPPPSREVVPEPAGGSLAPRRVVVLNPDTDGVWR